MQRVLPGLAAMLLMPAMAAAADLSPKTPLKSPAAVAHDWTGFYAGGYWGTSLGQSSAGTPGSFANVVDLSKRGWTAGGTAGANWQAGPNWLLGVEADLGYLANDRRFAEWNDTAVTAGVKSGGYGTVRGRFGYVTGPSLIYLTGGAAFVQVENTFGGCGLGVCGANLAPVTVSGLKTGWTVGAGIESRISQNWSRKTEYMFVDAGTTSFASNPFAGVPTASFRNQFHVIKTGLNYRFGGPSEPLPFFGGEKMLPTDHDWAGFYAGVNGGGGITTGTATALAPLGGETDFRGAGFAGGLQAGYNAMNLIRPSWFAGIEGDIGYLGINSAKTDWNDAFGLRQRTDWYGTVRGRFGSTSGPALFYFTGGAAFVNVRNEFGIPGTIDSRSDTRAGWTMGGGTEVALDARWSAKLEYLYIDAGKSSRAITLPGPVTLGNESGNRFHVVRAGLNYGFNAPVVARY